MHKDTKKIVKAAESRGWILHRCSKHYQMVRPGAGRVTFSASPSCAHAVKNFEKDLERADARILDAKATENNF